MKRKKLIIGAAVAALVAAAFALVGNGARGGDEIATVTVYKSPTCGCCAAWADLMAGNGFDVETRNVQNLWTVKAEHRVPRDLATCHTAIVDGYVIEGHVPPDLVLKLLEERPAVAGLAVPGMPAGSPGMEGPYPPERYDVLAFDRAGRTAVYAQR